ncbi:uncharacterized protein MAM_00377 [Metarhizium album ARSEF 1941]|uniref:DNA/RNA-binding domain-containing protein n=1 Tax=Metarhizium album (strain ARSEF 1941) TaxID=1081103 RepID=A0A0B2X7W0_METAS|nr:uncharacterized protein MAM_00377 [Metarhizium album ARSEF 1941]KHO01376.1 hypothetical protein MAM_00377 [Metarhizium album ARSEF 1941]
MDKLTQGWVQHQRKAAREEDALGKFECPICATEVHASFRKFRDHFRSKHPAEAGNCQIEEAFKKCSPKDHEEGDHDPAKSQSLVAGPSKVTSDVGAASSKSPISGNRASTDGAGNDLERLNLTSDGMSSSRRRSEQICSTPASVAQQPGPSPSTPGGSGVRLGKRDEDFVRGTNPSGRQLWIASDEATEAFENVPGPPQTTQTQTRLASSSTHRRSSQHRRQRNAGHHRAQSQRSYDTARAVEMIRELVTREICSDQLVPEITGIYSGIILLESKCMEYGRTQLDVDLNPVQYKALSGLHRSLLNEYHDFLLASQHPSASEKLKDLPSRLFIPARMWRHGIHSYLELLRRKLPGSHEYMLSFVYIAYSMVGLLYETIPLFRDTWIECLGDLGRYRMAIEDSDIQDRENWTRVSRNWYTMASNKIPRVGRLYHHLAILARPDVIQQLFFYAKSLCVPVPFPSSRETVKVLFDPLLDPESTPENLAPVDLAFVRVHGLFYFAKEEHKDLLHSSMQEFLSRLEDHIERKNVLWRQHGYLTGISLGCLLLGYGDKSNVLMRVIPKPQEEAPHTVESQQSDSPMEDSADVEPSENFKMAVELAARTYKIVIDRNGDPSVLPCIHTLLVFYQYMLEFAVGRQYLEDSLPWAETADVLNYLVRLCDFGPRSEDSLEFPMPEPGDRRPLPEDYALRGLLYTQDYFPEGWFDGAEFDETHIVVEPPSIGFQRYERILWLGRRIAMNNGRLLWDQNEKKFFARVNDELKDEPIG